MVSVPQGVGARDRPDLAHGRPAPGTNYLTSPCGQRFDRDDVEEAPYPVDDPPPHAPEPCVVCVMRLLLTEPPQTGEPHD